MLRVGSNVEFGKLSTQMDIEIQDFVAGNLETLSRKQSTIYGQRPPHLAGMGETSRDQAACIAT